MLAISVLSLNDNLMLLHAPILTVAYGRIVTNSFREQFELTMLCFLLQRDIFFTYYPKRFGQVLFMDAPWIFQPSWKLFKPLLGKYSGLVAFVSREQLRDNYFTPETVPEDFKQD